MEKWTFKKYCDENGVSDIDDWRSGLPPKARTRMDKIIAYLETETNWRSTPYLTPLVGYEGILEIKFTVNNIQYRPLGCYGSDKTFIILCGAEERGDRFEPQNAPEIAVERRQRILADKRYVNEYY